MTIVVAGVVGGAAEVAIRGGRPSRHGGYDFCVLCVVGEFEVMRKY